MEQIFRIKRIDTERRVTAGRLQNTLKNNHTGHFKVIELSSLKSVKKIKQLPKVYDLTDVGIKVEEMIEFLNREELIK